MLAAVERKGTAINWSAAERACAAQHALQKWRVDADGLLSMFGSSCCIVWGYHQACRSTPRRLLMITE